MLKTKQFSALSSCSFTLTVLGECLAGLESARAAVSGPPCEWMVKTF